MRGADRFTERLLTLSRLKDFIPADHPLRQILPMVNQALGQMYALCSSMRFGLQRRCERRTSQHRPGEADPGDALAGVLQRTLGAHAHSGVGGTEKLCEETARKGE